MMSYRWSFAILLCLLFAANVAVGQALPLFPKYQVLGVIYAPPGSTSSVSYTNSTQIGSSHSIVLDSSTTTTKTESDASGFGLFGIGYTQTDTITDQWTADYQNTSSISLQTTTGNGISVPGAISSGLGVVHDDDLIVVWLNPVYETYLMTPVTTNGVTTYPIEWGGFQFNSCDVNATQYTINFMQAMNGCNPYSFPGPDIVYIPVYCLKNPYYNPATNHCSEYLAHTSRFWDLNPWGGDSVTKVPLGPGLDLQDYADILQADPLVTQTLVANNGQAGENVYTNPCHPTYGINFDPNTQESIPDPTKFSAPYAGTWSPTYCGTPGSDMQRFNYFSATISYPAPQSNGQPTTLTGSLNSSAVTTNGKQSTDTHTHSINESISQSFAAGVTYGAMGYSVTNLSVGFNLGTTSGTGTSWTDGQTIGATATTGQTGSASYSVTGPKLSDNWDGPITYNVYQDTVYGTFAFWDPNRSTSTELITTGKTSPIGVAFSGSTNFGTVIVGQYSAPITVTLTNNSPNQLTMQSPALSFSDLAVNPNYAPVNPADSAQYVSSFVIVGGSDGCSNKVLAANATCILKIEFAPDSNAAPNTAQTSYPVAAYVIAAGVETVPVTDSGAPTYNEVVLVTNTVITVSGKTETAVTVSGTAVPLPVSSCTTSENVYPACDLGATLFPASPVSGQPNGYQFTESNDTAETEKFTFTNYFSSPVTFAANPQDMALTDAADFAVLNTGSTLDVCSGATVQPHATCSFTLQFLPKGGILSTRITAMGTVNWPTSVSDVTSLAIAGAAGTEAAISLSSGYCNDPNDVLSCTKPIIYNRSTLYSFVQTSGGGTNYFSAGICVSPIAPGQSCAVPIGHPSCTPAAGSKCTLTGTISVEGSMGGGPAVFSATAPASYTASCPPRGCGVIE